MEAGRNLRQPVARRPAHQAGRRVYARSRPEFPDAGIRFVMEIEGALPKDLEPGKIGVPCRHEQPRVEKYRRRPEHKTAIGVILKMLVGLIANAYRPHPTVSREIMDRAFGEVPLER